jgi:hypothetical protein
MSSWKNPFFTGKDTDSLPIPKKKGMSRNTALRITARMIQLEVNDSFVETKCGFEKGWLEDSKKGSRIPTTEELQKLGKVLNIQLIV